MNLVEFGIYCKRSTLEWNSNNYFAPIIYIKKIQKAKHLRYVYYVHEAEVIHFIIMYLMMLHFQL